MAVQTIPEQVLAKHPEMEQVIPLIRGFALVLVLALSCAAQTTGTDWSSVVSRTKGAVVVVQTDRGLGSGFLVRPNGTLVTNRHVISGATQIEVTLASGEKYHKAFVLAEDDDRDLAILRIEGSGLPSLHVANSSDVDIGQEVLLIGAPEGLSHTVSSGIVSALRLLKAGTKVIQTTAPASPGSSGGPLLTREGRVIGVLTFGFKEGQNLNFAVPSNYVQAMLETLETHSGVTPLRTLTRLETSTRTRSEAGTGPDASQKAKLNGILFVAWRTDRHRAYSSSEVFRGIVDEVLLFLKQSRLKLANDDLGRSLQVEHAISIYEVTTAARKAGASHVMVLEVDRPLSSWVKLRMQCLTAEGAVLWEEEAKNSSWVKTGAGGAKAAMKEFKALVAKRLSRTPLPSDDPPPPSQ